MTDPESSSVARLVGLVALAAVTPWWAAAQPADPFSECEVSFAAAPDARDSSHCFYEVARRSAQWEQAKRRLEAHRGRHPENPWLHFYLGHVVFISQLSPRAEDHYREAVRIFEDREEVAGEVDARIELSRCLTFFGRGRETREVLERAFEIAAASGDKMLLAAVRIRQAFQLRHEGRDLDYAYRLLEKAEEDVFPNGPEGLKKQCLDAKAVVSYLLGRNDEFLRYKKRLLAMAVAAGDLTSEAEARYNIAVHHVSTELPTAEARKEARALFEAALAAARKADHRFVETQALFELGSLLEGAEGRGHLESCLEVAADLGSAGLSRLSKCRAALAATLVEEDPAAAKALIDLALTGSGASDDLWATVYGSGERLFVHWETLPRSEAVADSLKVLDMLEALRELQASGAGRTGLMTLLSEVYYRLSGRLLEGGDPEMAFAVLERLRARVLREALEEARAASPPPSASPLVEELTRALADQVRLNRRLLDPELRQGDREQAVTELDSVESLVARLRHQIAEAAPSYGQLRSPTLADLRQVEESLENGEALLSFQFGLDEDFYGRFAGGSWLFASTRDRTRVYRIPDRVALEPALDVLLGMADLDDATAALARLHGDLLAPALADLPPAVERLVIVPDGKLHRLPFALLRPSAEAEPLIARYQLSLAPSATLWRRWRSLDPPASEVPALALADPVIAGQTAEAEGAGVRQWAFERDARLPPLPYAREEGRAVVRALGGDSRLLVGEEASERFLKEADLRRYGVIHFAAHAVIDDEVPERSAVLLAPGAEEEDGWLQPQDVVGLDLDGRVVVLASCDSAAGQVLRGEGPMSLARAFFQARAPVVVASLEPLPDDHSARLFKDFYRTLARGTSVAEALAVAQRKRARQGVPSRAWAGLVVLGDGAVVPFPGGLERPGLPIWIVVALAFVGLAALWLVARRARRG